MLITSCNLWRQSLSLRLLLKWNNYSRQAFHNSTVYSARRGPVSDVTYKELIIDKPPTFYPTIQQKLDRINYYDIHVSDTNLGYEKDSKCVANFKKTSVELASHLKSVADNENEDAFDLDENSNNATLNAEEYKKLAAFRAYSNEYLDSTVALAHHFAIFRDLFFQVPVDLQTNQNLIVSNAKSDNNKFNIKSLTPTHSFLPLVPIDAQFYIEDGDEFVCQTSHRGNLISPEFGENLPTIVINTAAINGQSKPEELYVPSNGSPILLNSGSDNDPSYYTLALVNLDSHFNDSGVCHWMLTNIHKNNNETTYETAIKYLPIYGIRGLGYHRYAFVLFKHNKPLTSLEKIEDYDLGKRKFNGLEFMNNLSTLTKDLELKPVGLSWFQTTWNENCTKVFYDYLNMKQPSYEYVQPKQITEFKQWQFPGRAPFNLYLDHFRDPKEMAKEVLLERLKSINPFESYDTKKMYPGWDGKPKLPHIHPFPKNTPDWLKSNLLKKRSLIGRYRALRPASAILPHNNNADLDNPTWPRIPADVLPLNCPNPYPDGKRRPKPLRDTLWTKPLPEHHSLRIDFGDNLTDEKDKINFEQKSIKSKN